METSMRDAITNDMQPETKNKLKRTTRRRENHKLNLETMQRYVTMMNHSLVKLKVKQDFIHETRIFFEDLRVS